MIVWEISHAYFYFTVNSFLELIPYLFKIKGVSCFLSEKLSQDPLEKFFGCQRQSGTNDNPTVAQFLKNTQNLRVINSICLHEVTGNCKGTKRKSYDLESADLEKPLKKEDGDTILINNLKLYFILCAVKVYL